MIKFIFGILILFFIVSCQGVMSKKPSEEASSDIVKNITYVKDKKTGLCFATVLAVGSDGWNSSSITCVPCDSLKNVPITVLENK